MSVAECRLKKPKEKQLEMIPKKLFANAAGFIFTARKQKFIGELSLKKSDFKRRAFSV